MQLFCIKAMDPFFLQMGKVLSFHSIGLVAGSPIGGIVDIHYAFSKYTNLTFLFFFWYIGGMNYKFTKTFYSRIFF